MTERENWLLFGPTPEEKEADRTRMEDFGRKQAEEMERQILSDEPKPAQSA